MFILLNPGYYEDIFFVVSGLFVTILFFLVMNYLQTGFRRKSFVEEQFLRLDNKLLELGSEVQTLSSLTERLSDLENQLENIELTIHEFSDTQRNELINRVNESIKQAAVGDFLDEIKASIRESEARLSLSVKLQEQYESTIKRLNSELTALTRRGNVNLALGIATAIGGIALLGNFIFNSNLFNSDLSAIKTLTFEVFAMKFAPHISLVILVEIFAYFFLRLYSTSLMEIKYFQNEITNVESKYLALQTATNTRDIKIIGSVISQFAQTERNYILQKGQTTVDLERSKIEKNTITSLSQNFIKALSRRQQS